MRGGEKVLEVFCEIYPQADLFTLIHIPGTVSKVIEGRSIKTSFIQNLPLAKSRYRSYLPLFPMAMEGFDLKGYDLIISTSHCVAKGVIPGPDSLHISYIFTPMRYVWDMYPDYFGNGRSAGMKGRLISLFSHYLRMWDSSSSNRVDCFIAISELVAKRVRKYYRRDAEVLYPPVDSSGFRLSDGKREDFYLIVSAFAPYKRLDIAIEAFNSSGRKLKIIGTGQDEKRLKRSAGENIEFLGWKTDEELAGYYGRCKALVFPGVEDFGIVPLEAMAAGAPVIAFGGGGALETVVPLGGGPNGSSTNASPTGVFFNAQTARELAGALERFEDNMGRFDPSSIRAHALKFDRKAFKDRAAKIFESKYREHERSVKC